MPDEVKKNEPPAPLPTPLPPPPPLPPAKTPAASGTESVGLRVSLIPTDIAEEQDPQSGFRTWVIVSLVGLLLLGAAAVGAWVNVSIKAKEVARIETDLRDA